MSSTNLARVVRSSLWLYLRSLINNVSGFIYWLIISAIGGAEIVGLTSATVALAGIINTVISLGSGTGVQRFIGALRAKGDKISVSDYFWTTFLFNVIISLPISLFFIALGLLRISFNGLSGDMFFFTGIIVLLSSLTLFESLLVSHVETKPILLGYILANAVRLPLGIGLVLNGWGWIGAVIGVIATSPLAFIIELFPSLKLVNIKLNFKFKALKDVLKAGFAAWLPSMIAVLGQQLGVLTLFGISGAFETGLYYISFAIMGLVVGIGSSILGLMMPVLSGMEDGRKRASWRAIKISLVLVTPLAFILAAYPYVPLSLLGKQYENAAPMLMLLAISILPALINTGVTSLIYAYGMYSFIIILGLVESLSRIITYVPLSHLMGGTGIALSYTLGSYMAFIATILVSKRIGFNPGLKEAALITVLPLTLAVILNIFSISWFIGAPLILLISYVSYLKFRILSRDDLRELAYALAPKRTVSEIYEYLRPIIDRLIS